jgi:hypothetical protein
MCKSSSPKFTSKFTQSAAIISPFSSPSFPVTHTHHLLQALYCTPHTSHLTSLSAQSIPPLPMMNGGLACLMKHSGEFYALG